MKYVREAIWILFFSAILFAIIHPRLEERHYGSRYNSKETLSQLGKALYGYTQNNNEWLPPSLWDLYPEYIGTTKFFNLIMPPEDTGEWYRRCIYLYPGGVDTSTMLNDTRIAIMPYEPEGNRIGMNSLYVDGHVRWEIVGRGELEQILSTRGGAQ